MGKKVTSTAVDHKAAWHDRAPALARWVWNTLVNRTDRCGRYYAVAGDKTRSCADPAKSGDAHDGFLDLMRLQDHFWADGTDEIVGIYSYGADKSGKWIVVDIDKHDERADGDANRRYALRLYEKLTGLGFVCLLYESNGNGGFHLWVLFASPVPAAVLYRFGNWAVRDHSEHSQPKPPEVFPKSGGTTPWGSFVRLPGRHHTRAVWSAVWTDAEWAEGADAVEHILSIEGGDPVLIPADVVTGEAKSDKKKAKKTKKTTGGRKSVPGRLPSQHVREPRPRTRTTVRPRSTA